MIRHLAVIALLVFAGLLVFWPVGRFDFLFYDDPIYVYANPAMRLGLTLNGVRWSFQSTSLANWHPLTWLSHQVDSRLFGGWAGGHHLSSLALHIGAAILLYMALSAMTGAFLPSAIAAVLFTLHPLHVESLAWVSERKDVLCAFFWMASLLAYVGYLRRPGPGRYLVLVTAVTMALLAKPMAVTLPLVFFILDWWPLGRMHTLTSPAGKLRLLLEKILPAMLAVSAGMVSVFVQAKADAIQSLTRFPIPARLENALTGYFWYITKTIWPYNLSPFYTFPNRRPLLWLIVLAGGGLIFITFLAFKHRRRGPFVITGWLWYLVTLAPVAGFVQVGYQSRADRYGYLPSVGLFMAVCWAGAALFGKRRLLLPVGIAVGLCLAAMSWAAHIQTLFWRDSLSLYNRALAIQPDNWLAYSYLSVYFDVNRRATEAESAYRKLIDLKDDYPLAHNNLGVLLQKSGRAPEAIEHYRKAIRIKADYADAHYNLGLALSQIGRHGEAAESISRAAALEPESFPYQLNLGYVYEHMNRWDLASAAHRRAAALDPKDAMARYRLGLSLIRLGDIGGAMAELGRLRSLDRGLAEALARQLPPFNE